MKNTQIRRLPGMSDVTKDEYQRLSEVLMSMTSYMSGRRYDAIDTPLLEETGLFARKSGGEFAGQLYTFTDPGGRQVSLRPEFTSSVIRYLVQEMEALTLPVRWQYSGPVFRYDRDGAGTLAQFTQVGAELIGAGGAEADAEVLSVACGALQEIGLQTYRLRVGHRGVIQDVLGAFGLSERAELFVVGNVDALKSSDADVDDLVRQAEATGLLDPGRASGLVQNGRAIDADSTRETLKATFAKEIARPFGRRGPDEVIDRLLRKAREADDPSRLAEALGVVGELARVEGRPETALERARGIIGAAKLESHSLADVAETVDKLQARGVDGDRLTLDLGLVRGIHYYTGVVFEMCYPTQGGEASFGGGGRYDGLVRTLGGEDIPALGFAFTLEEVLRALERQRADARASVETSATVKETSASSRGP